MRFCPRCNTGYSDEERVCPKDGAALALRAQPPREPTQAVAPDQEGTAYRPRNPPRQNGDRAEDLIGRQLGNYRVTSIIGRGGMGRVYEAEHVLIRRKVALKVLRAEYAARRDAVMRFIGEATAVNKIRHRNIVDISDFVELDDGTTFIIMELLEGDSLGKLQRVEPKMPMARLLNVMVQVADALEAAHAVGIIHRDLKPDNIFVCPEHGGGEVAKLLDFGVAKLIAEQQTSALMLETAAGSIVGTPAYMSPEQAVGGEIDGRSDVYALGAILYELATGVPLFDGRNFAEFLDKHRFAAPVPPSQLPGVTMNPQMERIILRCVAKKPADRYQNVRDLRADLVAQQQLLDPVPNGRGSQGGRRPSAAPAQGAPHRIADLDDVVASLAAPSVGSGSGSGRGQPAHQQHLQQPHLPQPHLPQPPPGAQMALAPTEHQMAVPAFARASNIIGPGHVAPEPYESGEHEHRRSSPGASGRRSSADVSRGSVREAPIALGGLQLPRAITPRTLALIGGGLGALALCFLVYALVKPGGGEHEGEASEPEVTPISSQGASFGGSTPATPTQRPVEISFTSDPPAAEVYAEGSAKLQCRTPCRISISPDDGGPTTSRAFTLKKPGFVDYPTIVSLTERDTQSVTAMLMTETLVPSIDDGDRRIPRRPRVGDRKDDKPDRKPVDKKTDKKPATDKKPVDKAKPVVDPGATLDPFKS